MKSKTSFLHNILITKNLRRFWPIWALWLLVSGIVMPVQLYISLSQRPYLASNGDYSFFHNTMVENVGFGIAVSSNAVLIFFFAMLTAIAIFKYLFTSKSCNMMHAFPRNRKQLFFANYVSGLLILFVPTIIVYLIAMPGAQAGAHVAGYVAAGLVFALAKEFIFYTIAVFCCMISGHPVAAIAFDIVFNILFVGIKCAIMMFLNLFGYGLNYSVFDFVGTQSKADALSPVVFLCYRATGVWSEYATKSGLQELHATGFGIIGIYCIVMVALIFVIVKLYKMRQLERAGEMSVFAAANPLARWIIGFLGGIVMAFVFTSLIRVQTDAPQPSLALFLVMLVIWGLVCFVLTEMILKKTFRIFTKKRILEGILLAVVCVVLICAINAFTNKKLINHVPETGEIQAAAICGNYPILAENADEIDAIRTLHQTALDNREAIRQTDSMATINIRYALKDGSILERSYPVRIPEQGAVDENSTLGQLDRMESDITTAFDFAMTCKYNKIKFTNGQAFDATHEEGQYSLSASETKKVFAALQEDFRENNMCYHTKDTHIASGNSYGIVINGTVDGSSDTLAKRFETAVNASGQKENAADQTAGDYTTNMFDQFFVNSSHNINSPELTVDTNKNGSYTTTVNTTFFINKNCKHTIKALRDCGIKVSEKDFDSEDIVYDPTYEEYD